MKKRLYVAACLLILVSFSLTGLVGCKSASPGEYRRFTVNEGLASFSFEYPSSFLKPGVYASNETHYGNYTRVSTLGGPPLPERGIEFLTISVISPNDSYPNSSAMLESELRSSQEILSDFRLLERAPISVSGGSGELIIFSYGGFTPVDPLDEPQTGIANSAYFDRGGFIWKIELISDERAAQQARTHLDHILQTLKFLD